MIILSNQGKILDGITGPYDEGSSFMATCETHGGKSNIFHTNTSALFYSLFSLSDEVNDDLLRKNLAQFGKTSVKNKPRVWKSRVHLSVTLR